MGVSRNEDADVCASDNHKRMIEELNQKITESNDALEKSIRELEERYNLEIPKAQLTQTFTFSEKLDVKAFGPDGKIKTHLVVKDGKENMTNYNNGGK